jgi:hypothetical protein
MLTATRSHVQTIAWARLSAREPRHCLSSKAIGSVMLAFRALGDARQRLQDARAGDEAAVLRTNDLVLLLLRPVAASPRLLVVARIGGRIRQRG